MKKIDFTTISNNYEHDSVIQKSAGDKIIDLVSINQEDDVLDLGCGTAYLTRKIRALTGGKVVGVDPSEGMINENISNKENNGIDFIVSSAEKITFDNQFDVIICNSAFQWFKNVEQAISNCFHALRSNGRMVIQAPATPNYSPNFIQAVGKVKYHPDTKDIFSQFIYPWLFYNTEEEYQSLFERAGFKVPLSKIETVHKDYTSEEAYKIFGSGAAAGYLNQDYYNIPIDDHYIGQFQSIVKQCFIDQADDKGIIDLIFNRIYLLAVKE